MPGPWASHTGEFAGDAGVLDDVLEHLAADHEIEAAILLDDLEHTGAIEYYRDSG